mmetsp:Transcript_102875/g.182754  ORF Transcript_102875/g.182754 Transcript_102875/m.182754 type:complete len:84 (+) Transcript_102875:273-524(+)
MIRLPALDLVFVTTTASADAMMVERVPIVIRAARTGFHRTNASVNAIETCASVESVMMKAIASAALAGTAQAALCDAYAATHL